MAKAILEILPQIKNEQVAIYHFANSGACTWYEFAKAIFEIKGIDLRVNPILTNQYPTSAIRPKYSVLETNKIKMVYGTILANWKNSLNNCLNKLK